MLKNNFMTEVSWLTKECGVSRSKEWRLLQEEKPRKAKILRECKTMAEEGRVMVGMESG